MKKLRHLLTVLLLLCATVANAQDFEVDGIYYNIHTEERSVEVTCYYNSYNGSVVIPESVTYNGVTYSVTSIGNSAFYDCTGLTSITIPNSVTSIGYQAFYNCSGLTSITIPNSVTSIGSSAFEGCTWLKSVTIGNGVTSIENSAFSSCSGLISITIPNSVESIGYQAFYNCSGLTSILIPGNVRQIDSQAFEGCYSLKTVVNSSGWLDIVAGDEANGGVAYYADKVIVLSDALCAVGDYVFAMVDGVNVLSKYIGNDTDLVFPESCNGENYVIAEGLFENNTAITSVVIPNSVTSIGERAFCYCSALTSVTIGSGVTSIGNYAFYSCSGLTSITIPNSVTSIGDGAFYDCTGLTSVTIGNRVTSIGDEAFYSCSGLTSITIPGSVTSIGSGVFWNCIWLTSVTFENGVTSIGEKMFLACRHLTSVTIPNSVTSIGDGAFSNCSGLTSIEIPNSVTSIGDNAFADCSRLTSITFSNNVTTIGERSFANTPWYDNQPDGVIYAGKILFKYKGTMPANTSIVVKEGTTQICSYALEGCTSLISITIPNSVESIGESAFEDCIWLKSVTIGNGVTSIENRAFYNCASLTSIEIPNSVTNIGGSAFEGCISLTSITIPNSVESIGESVLEGCSGLTSVTIGNSVTSIGASAFEDCTHLASVTIPNCVTSIGSSTFKGCIRLESVTIGNGVTSIGASAFEGCTSLASVSIPNSVTSISSSTFKGCTRLNEVHINDIAAWCNIDFEDYNANPLYYAHNLYLNNELITELVIPNGVTEINDYAFEYCTGLTSITIPNSVTSIGSSAFWGCSGLTSIAIPNSVTSIGSSAFRGCSNLTSITIPNSVTSIGNYAFYNCSGLTSVTIPNSVTSIGDYAFQSCTGLTSVTIPNSVTSIGNGAFAGCNIERIELNCPSIGNWFTNKTSIKEVVIGNSVTSIGGSAFEGCTGLTSVTIGNSVTSIGDNAFENCSKLTSVTIGNSVTSIGDYAFGGCSGLTSITIPNSVTSIGGSAFEGCISLISITIPNSVESIGESAFEGCSGLTSVTIGNSVTSIGARAFADCSGLTSITIPNSVTSIENSAFEYCSGLTSVEFNATNCTSIGSSNYPAFKGCTSLSIVTIGENVKNIPAYAFYECSGLTSVTIGNSVTSIGNSAFYGCYKLTSVTIGNSVTSIGESAFYNCDALTSVEIPNSVTSIGNSAFNDCSRLTSITIPNSVTSIGDAAFRGCEGLTSITIGNGVTSIGDYAFLFCTGLTSITIPNSVTSIGYEAFYKCSGLTSVTIGNSVTSIGGYAFLDCYRLKTVYNSSSLTFTKGSTGYGYIAYYAYEIILPKTYALTFVVDGEVFRTDSIEYGDEIVLPEVEEREGYTFDGWKIPNGKIAIDIAADADRMLYSNAPCTNTTYNDQFVSWDVLFDNNAKTIFHSEYGNTQTVDGLDHYIRVDMGEGNRIGMFEFTYMTREGNDRVSPKTIVVEGSNEAFGEYTEIATLTNLPGAASTTYNSDILGNDNIKYRYIRYRVTETSAGDMDNGHPFFAISEFGMSRVYNDVPTTMPDFDVTLECCYVKKKSALKYVVDGEVFRTDSIEYGDEIVLPEMEEREGYTFSGWKRVVDKISIDIAADADRMLYSNAPCTNTTYNDQFVSWDVLFDNNAKTIFHSEYGNKQTVDGLDHYIRVDMGEGNSVGSFEFTYMTRAGNDRVSPKTIVVEGSNEAFGEYTEIATLTNLPGAASTTYNSDILGDDNIKYRYIRYRVTETSAGDMDNGHPFFAISEFGMSRVYNDVPTTMPDFGFTLEGSYIPNAISSISELKNNVIYHVSQPHHSSGKTAWAIIPEISDEIIANDWFVNVSLYDECQQFAFISNNNGKTHYLYHPAEKVFVNKDGSLSETPVDAISFKDGAYENTFVAYFDNEHYININAEITLDINGWNTPDGGNSCLLVPVGTFDPTDALRAIDNATAIENVECEETETVIYDLQGRRIKEITASGIYIINGKKTIVR